MHLVWALHDLGRGKELSDRPSDRPTAFVWFSVALLILGDDYIAAADRLEAMGDRPDEAYARLRAAEQLVGRGRVAEARAQLDRDLAFYRSVGATRYVAEAETLLVASA